MKIEGRHSVSFNEWSSADGILVLVAVFAIVAAIFAGLFIAFFVP